MRIQMHRMILLLVLILISAKVLSVSVSCSPNPQTASLSQAFTIAVNLDTTTQIRGYSIRIQFDPALLSLSQTSRGTLFNGQSIFWWRNINEAPGIQRIECIIAGYGVYVQGPGNLFNLTMTSLAQGYSPIDFLTTEIYAPDATIIPNVSSSPGAVLIGSNFLYTGAQALLQGAWNNDSMDTDLSPFLPLSSPYSTAPFTVATMPSDVVDWLLVELRTTTTGGVVNSQSVFLHADGRITSPGKPFLLWTGIPNQAYFLIIRHRNHLGVMSSVPITFSTTGAPSWYDFRIPANVYGQGGIVSVADGIFALAAGDSNQDGLVNTSDRNAHWRTQTGLNGYLSGDLNLDGFVSPLDLIRYWHANQAMVATIPGDIR